MITKTFTIKQVHQGRLPFESDLMDGLKAFCEERGIRAGHISGMGALKNATMAYYDQEKKEYSSEKFDFETEILMLKGNVSLKDGEVFCHVHLTLSKEDYSVIGGHATPGCTVFACEFEVVEYEADAPFERGFDADTGLFLWQGD